MTTEDFIINLFCWVEVLQLFQLFQFRHQHLDRQDHKQDKPRANGNGRRSGEPFGQRTEEQPTKWATFCAQTPVIDMSSPTK